MVDTSTEAVTKLLDGVTPGPWGAESGHVQQNGQLYWQVTDKNHAIMQNQFCWCQGDHAANARFIAAARDLVPALLAERDALRAEVERLKSQPEPIREITDADMANIVAHLSYECEPKGPLPNANSLMMEVVRLRNAISDDKA